MGLETSLSVCWEPAGVSLPLPLAFFWAASVRHKLLDIPDDCLIVYTPLPSLDCTLSGCSVQVSLFPLNSQPSFTATRQSSPALEKLVPRLFPSFPANLTTTDPSTARASFSPVSSHPEKPKASFPSLVGPRPASPSLSLGQNCHGLSLRSLFFAVSVIVAAIALSGVLRLRRRKSHCTVPWSFDQVLWSEPSCAAKTKSATISPPLPAF